MGDKRVPFVEWGRACIEPLPFQKVRSKPDLSLELAWLYIRISTLRSSPQPGVSDPRKSASGSFGGSNGSTRDGHASRKGRCLWEDFSSVWCIPLLGTCTRTYIW